MDGYDVMESYRKMIQKACAEDAKERFRKKTDI